MRTRGQNLRCIADLSARIRFRRFSLNGFTLIELLISLALMIVVFTMLWGFGSQNNQTQQKNRCQQNLQKLYLAMEIYANDNHSEFPFFPAAPNSAQALAILVPKYNSDTSIFICPGSKDSEIPAGEPIAQRRISYAYYMGRRIADKAEVLLSDRQIDTEAKAAGQLVFSSTGQAPGNNHHKYGGNFLFCDGRLETTPARVPFSLVLTQGVVLLNP